MKNIVFYAVLLTGCNIRLETSVVSTAVIADASILNNSDDAGVPEPTDAGKITPNIPCIEGMAPVEGMYCPQVKQDCLQWLDVDKSGKAIGASEPTRCAKFAPSVCLSKARQHMKFCMDIYEYPNIKGEYPRVDITYYQAESICKSLGKRMCNEEEWTFACEGEDMLPYPYGYERRNDWCNIDHLGKNFNIPRSQWHTIYQGIPSGSMEKCVSVFGIYDQTGNADELVFNNQGNWNKSPYHSGLKGGAWLRNRNRCRKMTVKHGPEYSFYQEGFRCCKDI